MIQKDLNLFSVYRSGSSKDATKSIKGISLIIASFVAVVILSYVLLAIVKMSIQGNIDQLTLQMNTPSMVENQVKLANENSKKDLLNKYYSALKAANLNFVKSRIIDETLISNVSSSLPPDVSITNILISQLSIEFSGRCINAWSPAVLEQTLNRKGVFKSISFDGITIAEGKGYYTFKMNCTFNDLVSKEVVSKWN